MPVAVTSPPELRRGGSATDAAAVAQLAKSMVPRDASAAAPAGGGGARTADSSSGKQQADAPSPLVPLTPHVTSTAAARDQLLVAGATPESSLLTLLVR